MAEGDRGTVARRQVTPGPGRHRAPENSGAAVLQQLAEILSAVTGAGQQAYLRLSRRPPTASTPTLVLPVVSDSQFPTEQRIRLPHTPTRRRPG